MMCMFWSKKAKERRAAKQADQEAQAAAERSAQIRAEAMANARAARAALGNDTIQKITEIMKKMESEKMKQAQAEIQKADPDLVLDELKFMMSQKHKRR